MVEFKFVLRGEGFVDWATSGGYRWPLQFNDVLSRTPEPLLDRDNMSALSALLAELPTAVDRWTSAQRNEGRRLALLIEASTADAVVGDVKTLLCFVLRGNSLLRRGRPKRSIAYKRQGQINDRLAAHLVRQVSGALDHKATFDQSSFLGPVPTYGDLADLPLKERAFRTAHRMLQECGFEVSSLRTFRNRISAYRIQLKGIGPVPIS